MGIVYIPPHHITIRSRKIALTDLNDIASPLEIVSPNSIIHTAVTQPEIDFVSEQVTEISALKSGIISIDDVMLVSDNKADFLEYLQHNMSDDNVTKIEMLTRGQSDNALWFSFWKGAVNRIQSSRCFQENEKVKRRWRLCKYVLSK